MFNPTLSAFLPAQDRIDNTVPKSGRSAWKKPCLFTKEGQRKYLTETERNALIDAAKGDDPTSLLCSVIAHTGCRLSEALNLRTEHIDAADGTITFESLKKRTRGVYRAVPVPPLLLKRLLKTRTDGFMFVMGRSTAWGKLKRVMLNAGVPAFIAYPRALRHSFGVVAVVKGVPLTMLKKWMGHSNIAMTEIYTQALGAEERAIAERMWR